MRIDAKPTQQRTSRYSANQDTFVENEAKVTYEDRSLYEDLNDHSISRNKGQHFTSTQRTSRIQPPAQPVISEESMDSLQGTS